MDTTQGTEFTPSATGAESTASTETQTAEVTSQSTPAAEGLNTDPAAPVYTPNYKFKVMDKDHEIPESFRGIIKDATTEKQVRELYEKAYGLEHVKTDRDAARNQFKEYRTQADPIVHTYQTAASSYNRAMQAMETGNMKGAITHLQDAFGALKVPDKVLKQYVYGLLEMEDLPPAQKEDYNRSRELERQAYTQQQQLEQYQSQLQTLSVQHRSAELNQALSKPDVAAFVQSFDQRNGEGSFYNEVVMRGQYYANARGEDRSADAIVTELLTRFGHQAPQAQVQTHTPASAHTPPPVIPAIRGGSGGPSVVTKKVNSVAGLKKLAQQYTD
ncbi:hypothetical protein D3C87_125050 [compost metagenome]